MDHPELTFRLRAVPAAAFVDLLRAAGEPLDAGQLKDRLAAQGIDADTVASAWRRAQPGVKRHANIAFDARRGTYRWSDVPVPTPVAVVSAEQALDRILRGRLAAAVKAELGDLLRAALREREQLEARLRRTYQGERETRAAYERQVRADAARALAELAMEVEELCASGAAPDVLIERVRALVTTFDLEPIGRAGDEVTFDPARHAPIGPYPPDGTPVAVVRPGYTWRAGERDVLVGLAQVARVPNG